MACLNEQLLRIALQDSKVNATMLIDALTNLCKPKSTVQMLADHWAIALIGYSGGFVPWGFLVLVDFISPKWKPVVATRRSGYLSFCGAMLPMLIVLAYAAIQGFSEDYKEMFTAISAVALTFYHLARTAWGMAQLHAYREWCADALDCVYATLPSRNKKSKVNLDEKLLVNNQCIDNEFTGRDISVRPDLGNKKLVLSDPELCTFRWAGSFLCSLGNEWGGDIGNLYSLASTDLRSVLFLSHTTLRIPCEKHHIDMISVWENVDEWYRDGVDSGACQSLIKPFRLMSRYFHPSGSASNYKELSVYPPTMTSFKTDLESIISGFPEKPYLSNYFSKEHSFQNTSSNQDDISTGRTRNRELTNLVQVETLMIAKSLGPTVLSALAEERERYEFVENSSEPPLEVWRLFCNQVNAENEEYYGNRLHPLWELFTIPLWFENPNKNVLQASAHVDIEVALSYGEYFSHLHVGMDEKTERDTFESALNLTSHASLLNTRTFLGVGLDAVRTFLANWIISQGDSVTLTSQSWVASVEYEEFMFDASSYICNFNYLHCDLSAENFLKGRAVWEVQLALHTSLAQSSKLNLLSPASCTLAMLFLCSYPNIDVSWKYNKIDESVHFEISPINSPQKMKLDLILELSTRKMRAVIGTSGRPHLKFDWENWINGAMGLMLGARLGQKAWNRYIQTHRFKPADLSQPMIKGSNHLEEFPGEIYIWTGWPLFDVCVCQFESDQWMEAYFSSQKEQTKLSQESMHRHNGHVALETLLCKL